MARAVNQWAPGLVSLRDLADTPNDLLEVAFAVAQSDVRVSAALADFDSKMNAATRDLLGHAYRKR